MSKAYPLYLLTTSDKYELPLAVCESKESLASIAGVSVGTICGISSRRKKAKRTKASKYHVVWIEDEED